MTNKLTAVIPTKNRPNDLIKAIISILNQTRLPDELIVVDQSSSNESCLLINSLLSRNRCIQLVYIHDTHISGLVDAKRVATARAGGDIVCFLEDDVILEADYIEQMELGFINYPAMVGCCGIVTNPPKQVFLYELLFHIFHRGIFMDKRVGLYGRFNGRNHKYILSDMLSGGLSAWRREVFDVISFDIDNNFHMLEDIDFSTRVAQIFPMQLFINPNACLAHNFSPINRETLGPRQRRKLTECIVYYNFGYSGRQYTQELFLISRGC